MPASREYVDHVVELMRAFGAVEARRMFGGFGLYHEDLIFALVDDDNLYFRVDDETRPTFEALGLGPFAYDRNDPTKVAKSYRLAPADVLEDRAAMREWARAAYAAALRVRAAKAKPAKKAPAKKKPPAKKKRA